MQSPRQQLLAGTTFTQKQGRHVRRRDFFDHSANCEHGLTRGHDAVERRLIDLVLQSAILAFELRNIECAVDE